MLLRQLAIEWLRLRAIQKHFPVKTEDDENAILVRERVMDEIALEIALLRATTLDDLDLKAAVIEACTTDDDEMGNRFDGLTSRLAASLRIDIAHLAKRIGAHAA